MHLTPAPQFEKNSEGDRFMANEFNENDTDDSAEEDEQFSIAIDDSILSEALASVEKRMGRQKRKDDMGLGGLDLAALAAVEDELAIEIEEESAVEVEKTQASVEARLRAMEAEEEAENLQRKLEGLSENRNQIEQQVHSLRTRAQKSSDALRLAEQRNKNLKEALEKQQRDVDRLLERRKIERKAEYVKGKTDAVLALAEVIDNLFRALEHETSDVERLLEGVRMCLGQFSGNLGNVGIETIAPQPGEPFNPEKHEAIANESSTEVESGHIISIVTRGYAIEGKLIRAARVCVAD
jgi:molecular chaperone GrpE